MAVHILKTVQPYFDYVAMGHKTFEIRKDDRDFKVDDTLILREWNGKQFTLDEVGRKITYVLRDCPEYGLKKGFVILGIKPI